MARVLYFDCFSGISGDMVVGAFLDAGLPLDDLRDALGNLPLSREDIAAERVLREALYQKRDRFNYVFVRDWDDAAKAYTVKQQADIVRIVRDQGTAGADQQSRQDERHQLVAAHRITDEGGTLLVVADRLQPLAERRVHHPPGLRSSV